MGRGTRIGGNRLTLYVSEDVVDPARLLRLGRLGAIPDAVELNLSRDGDGDLLGREVRRVGDVQLAVSQLLLEPHRVVVAEGPDGRHHADRPVLHRLALAHHADAALGCRLHHLDPVRLFLRLNCFCVFHESTASAQLISKFFLFLFIIEKKINIFLIFTSRCALKITRGGCLTNHTESPSS